VRIRLTLFSLAVMFVAVGAAHADLGLTITTLNVRSTGVLRGYGNASGMPVYLIPESRAPRPFRCRGGTAYCAPHSWHPPGKPYVLLGYLRRTHPTYLRRRFAFRLPGVSPGRYQVVFWCKPCGRTLILAGSTLHGQVVTVRR
jgi:hypothetical protein